MLGRGEPLTGHERETKMPAGASRRPPMTMVTSFAPKSAITFSRTGVITGFNESGGKNE